MSVLSARQISVSFGGVRAVVDVDLDVGPGQLVGLIGPNGAGKTTFIDAITGFVPHAGRVTLDGRDITGTPPHARARHGLTRTWQAVELFEDLSVEENLNVAARHPSVLASVAEVLGRRSGTADTVRAALDALSLHGLADAMPRQLTQGQRKLVAVARALAAGPKLLCLDEPAAGLDAAESVELGRRLRQIVDGGTPILLVDHDMGLVLGICDHLVVLEFGTVIARGTPAEIRDDPAVVEAYLGRTPLPAPAQPVAPPDAPADTADPSAREAAADGH